MDSLEIRRRYATMLGDAEGRKRLADTAQDFLRIRLLERGLVPDNSLFAPMIRPGPGSKSGLLATIEGVPVYDADFTDRDPREAIDARLTLLYARPERTT